MPILGIIASSFLAAAGDYESISTVTVGSGGAANVEFTSIPGTYTHLQIRGIGAMTASGPDDFRVRFNSDTGNNYARHYIVGSGSTASAAGGGSVSFGLVGTNSLPTTANTFGAAIVDILDYANTNKYKTIRSLAGYDANGSGYVGLSSALWQNTNAITTITLFPFTSTFPQYSTFALYGIRT